MGLEGGFAFGEVDVEGSVEGGCSEKVAGVKGGHLKGDFAAHAVAHGDDLGGVDFGALLEDFHAGEKAFFHDWEFGSGFLGESSGVLGVGGDLTSAIHVDGEGGITELGDHVGTAVSIGIVSPPLVNDDNAGDGVFGGSSFGEREVAVGGDVASLVFEFSAGEGCEGG